MSSSPTESSVHLLNLSPGGNGAALRIWRLILALLATSLGAADPAAATAPETMKAAPSVPSPVAFTDNGQKLGTGDSWYVQLVDINGDGRLEAYFEGAIWLNDGQGHFTKTGQSFGPSNRPAYFADLNGDGFVDVVCDNVVFLNDGKSGFGNKRPLPTDVAMFAAHLADVNGDGSVDLIVAGPKEDRLLLNDGKGNFRDTGTSLGGWSQCTYAVGDLNGDHIPDIYVAIPHTPPPEMAPAQDKLWLGDGRGGFTAGMHAIPTGEHRGAILADLNGDGAADLLIGDPSGARVFLNDGKGNWTDSGQRLGRGGVVAADFNGDGHLDAFFSDGAPTDNGKPNTVWLNDGHGRFIDSELRLGNANSVAAAVGDLNGDGKPDVFVANVKNVITKAGEGFNEVWLNTTRR
jgi:FG-GAP-like repeat